MEWQDTTEEQDEALESLHQPFELLRDVHRLPTSRVRSITATDKDREAAALDLDLRAFPPLYKDEPRELRLKRMQAYQQTWQDLESDIKAVLDSANAETFDRLAEYAFEKHCNPHKRRRTGARSRMVATALAVAGSINVADHSETFPSLAACLRRKGCYAALLGAQDLPSGSSVAPALNAIIRQFSGLTTDADDMQALMAWYKDETEAGGGVGGSEVEGSPGADGILSPLGKMGLATPEKPAGKARGKRKGRPATVKEEPSQEAAGEGVTSPFGKLALQTPQKVNLRPRSGQQDPAAAQAAETDAEEKREAAQKPLVVIVEGVEGVDPLLLQDLILVLSENQAELPVVLVLGMSTSASALAQVVPSAASDMLATRNFHLVQALAKLEAVFSEVLVGGRHRLSLGHALMRDLDDHFMRHDFTVRTLLQGLKLACLNHFQRNPLSHLAPIPPPQLGVAVKELPPAAQKLLLDSLGLSPRSTLGVETLREAMQGLRAWKAGLRMLNAVALANGRKAMTDGLSLRELYRDASAPDFCISDDARLMRLDLERAANVLQPPAAASLLENLAGFAEDLGPDAADLLQDCQEALKRHHSKADAGEPETPAAEEVEAPDARVSGETDLENRDPNCVAGSHTGDGGSVRGVEGGGVKAANGKGAAGRRNALAKAVQVSKESIRPRQEEANKAGAAPLLVLVSKMLEAAFEAVSHPPCQLKGGSPFCVMDESRSRGLLGYAPRPMLDMALTRPEAYLGGEPLALSAEQQDTSIAYQLLTEYGEDVDVADWFAGFSIVYQANPVVEEPEEGPSPTKKGRRGRGRGSRKVLQDEEGDRAAAAGVEAARKQKKAAKRTLKKSEPAEVGPSESQEGGGDDDGEAVVPEYKIPLEELVARFTQATNELQLLGMVKAAPRKRRGNHAQRLVWAT